MKPTLLEVGNLQFHAYPAMLSLAFLVCTLAAARDGEKLLKPPVFIPPQGAIWALLGGMFGARVFHQLQYRPMAEWYRAIYIWEPGLVFFGGLIGGALGAVGYLFITKSFDWRQADICGPYAALGEAITRIGCFLNGCCWGYPTDLPWGIAFPRGGHAWDRQVEDGLISRTAQHSLHVHPTQLYMAVGLLLAFIFLRQMLKRSPFTFSIAWGYIFLYGVVRFAVEIFRGDSARSVFGMLTVSQAISMGFIIAAAIGYTIMERRARTAIDQRPEAPLAAEPNA